MRVRILGWALHEGSARRQAAFRFLTEPIPCLRARGRHEGQSAGKVTVGVAFAIYLRIIPGNRVKGRGLLVAAAPVGGSSPCGQLSPVPPGGFAANAGLTRIEGRGSERGSIAAPRAELGPGRGKDVQRLTR